jgi:hypothetical protein
MKKLLLAIFIITGFAACKSGPDLSNQNRDIHLLSDSTVYNNNVFSDTNATVKAEVIPAAISEKPDERVRPKTRKQRPAKVQTITKVPEQIATVPTVATPPVSTPPIVTAPATSESTSVDKSSGNDNSQTASTGTQVQKKKGMKKATQGAIIGGVAGAVGGAIISKKKGLGAVVGGIAGAAGGYIIGNKMDKKDNQFVTK